LHDCDKGSHLFICTTAEFITFFDGSSDLLFYFVFFAVSGNDAGIGRDFFNLFNDLDKRD
jgi:hypothetical protein